MLSINSSQKSSILAKVLVGTIILVVASVISLSGFFLLRHRAAFDEQFRLRTQSLAASLAGQGEFALLMNNKAELERIGSSALASDSDLTYILIEDATGSVIASALRPPVKREALPVGDSDAKQSNVRRVWAGQPASEHIEASIIVIPNAEGGVFGLHAQQINALGKIRVGMSLRSQDALFIATLRQVAAIAIAILAIACTLGYFQIRKLLMPLVELANGARLVGRGEAEEAYANKTGNDEIGDLVDSFNQMVRQVADRTRELSEQVVAKELARTELAEAQSRLMESSRKAGMAEVATTVLHNVGNVLNSVNVTANLLVGKAKESRVDKLDALLELIDQHPADLGSFLTLDPKGQRLVPYLRNLSSHLQQERGTMIRELQLLSGHVDHIKQIVATQQSYTKVFGLIGNFSLAALAEDAIRILESGQDSHQKVRIHREFAELPPIASDKHRIMQILLNLLRNASQAMEHIPQPDRLIQVRILAHGADRVRIEVEDRGAGLSEEHLTRIFAHGFTTKAQGHGFGLHSGALAAQELGGSLYAESEGPGCGARFILDLPMVRTAAQRETDNNRTVVV